MTHKTPAPLLACVSLLESVLKATDEQQVKRLRAPGVGVRGVGKWAELRAPQARRPPGTLLENSLNTTVGGFTVTYGDVIA